MATVIRAEISKKNKYYINKHRHYELKHFCLQYPTWKRECAVLDDPSIAERINLVEKIAMEADRYLYKYILKAVTEELSFTYLKSRLEIPCGRDMYYDRYRKFFWLLSEARQ